MNQNQERSERTCNLLNKRDQDETDEGITDATLLDHIWDLQDKENGDQRHARQRNEKCNKSLSQGELGLCQLFVAVQVLVFVGLVDLVEKTIVGDGLVRDIDQVSYKGDDRNTLRDSDCAMGDHHGIRDLVLGVARQILGEDGWKDQSHCAHVS